MWVVGRVFPCRLGCSAMLCCLSWNTAVAAPFGLACTLRLCGGTSSVSGCLVMHHLLVLFALVLYSIVSVDRQAGTPWDLRGHVCTARSCMPVLLAWQGCTYHVTRLHSSEWAPLNRRGVFSVVPWLVQCFPMARVVHISMLLVLEQPCPGHLRCVGLSTHRYCQLLAVHGILWHARMQQSVLQESSCATVIQRHPLYAPSDVLLTARRAHSLVCGRSCLHVCMRCPSPVPWVWLCLQAEATCPFTAALGPSCPLALNCSLNTVCMQAECVVCGAHACTHRWTVH